MSTEKNSASPYMYCRRFGQIAVEMGYITTAQLHAGLSEQAQEDVSHKPHRLLGEIYIEKGWMTPKQVMQVLTELSRAEKELNDCIG